MSKDTLVFPSLTYGNETWVPAKRDKSKIQTVEMRVKDCTTRDRIDNDDVRNAFNIYSLNQ